MNMGQIKTFLADPPICGSCPVADPVVCDECRELAAGYLWGVIQGAIREAREETKRAALATADLHRDYRFGISAMDMERFYSMAEEYARAQAEAEMKRFREKIPGNFDAVKITKLDPKVILP